MTNPTSSDWSREAIVTAINKFFRDKRDRHGLDYGELADTITAILALAAAPPRTPSHPDTAGEVERSDYSEGLNANAQIGDLQNKVWELQRLVQRTQEAAESQLAALTAVVAEKDAALEPFCVDFEWIDEEPHPCPDNAPVASDEYSKRITFADIRRARAALNKGRSSTC